MKLSERFKALSGKKGFGFVVLGLIAGILLLIIPNAEATADEDIGITQTLSSEYCASLEEKAKRLILSLPNVKSCEVFITLESGYSFVYATDQRVNETEHGKETEKNIVLAGNGSGEEPILIKESMPAVAGVAVVCTGADYQTQYRIIELMCALFDIKSNRISVQT
ncbi:MAG: hypothetical protein E7595_00275 [Ruminococcaceae bacterium]|nr:hypothetical protein [Oscillospiraceae bacterium]